MAPIIAEFVVDSGYLTFYPQSWSNMFVIPIRKAKGLCYKKSETYKPTLPKESSPSKQKRNWGDMVYMLYISEVSTI